MPLYEYQCTECGHQFELLMKNSNESPDKCPQCGATEISKLFSAFAVGASSSQRPQANCGQCAQAGACPFADD